MKLKVSKELFNFQYLMLLLKYIQLAPVININIKFLFLTSHLSESRYYNDFDEKWLEAKDSSQNVNNRKYV